MFGQALRVDDLQIAVSFNGDVDIEMKQVAPVTLTVTLECGKIEKVYADEGIDFASEGGFISVEYKHGADITLICDRRALQKKLAQAADDADVMSLHTNGE